MVKVVVCGAAGGIGQPLSLLLMQTLPPGSVLSLYDVVNVLGVGEDLSHVSTNVKLEWFLGDMKNPNNPEVDKALKDADVVVIPAGVPRKPGMSRDDLFKINAGIIRDLTNSIVKSCPKALIAIITNPVNSIVPVAAEILKQHGVFNASKLFGVSTLDVVRSQTFIGQLKHIDPTTIRVDVVGGHSAETIVPVLSQVQGVTFTDEEAKQLTHKIKEAGTVVVNAKDGQGSATLSMAFAANRFVLSLVRALHGEAVVENAYVSVDPTKFGVNYFAVPVEISKTGIVKVFDIPKLNDFEQIQLKDLMPVLQKNIETGVEFAKGSKL